MTQRRTQQLEHGRGEQQPPRTLRELRREHDERKDDSEFTGVKSPRDYLKSLLNI